jgi:hypothetical protein
MRQLGWIRVAWVLTLAVTAACGANSEGDVEARAAGFEATTDYLAIALDDLESSPHRFDMTMQMGVEIDGELQGLDPTRIVGEFDGERQYARLDGGDLFGQMGGGSGEQIIDLPGQALYVRSPEADEALDDLPDEFVTEYARALASLGDTWGRADLSVLADVLPENWQREVTQVRLQGLDPASFAGLVAHAESVEELEPAEVQGELMTGLTATVPAAAFTAAQQGADTTTPVTDPDQGSEPDSLGEVFDSLEYQVTAWIDGDGHIRRLELDQGDAMDQLGEAVDNPELEDVPGMGIVLTLDLFDYGDESIEVEMPGEHDTEDITAELRSLLETQQRGG